eukprot:scaffold291892_cov12-Tisochrysis_lutea.AAC.1
MGLCRAKWLHVPGLPSMAVIAKTGITYVSQECVEPPSQQHPFAHKGQVLEDQSKGKGRQDASLVLLQGGRDSRCTLFKTHES